MKNCSYPLYQVDEIETLGDMIKRKATEFPDKIAFRYSDAKKNIHNVTFSCFYSQVCKLANWISCNYNKKVHIAIVGENSYEWLLVFFATVCSGNVAVPIDKELQEKEISELANQTDSDVLFVSKLYKKKVAKSQKCIIYTFGDVMQIIQDKSEFVDINTDINNEDLACIFFTSGTSGKSKGVMLSHGNLASEINGASQMFELNGDTLSVLPFHHSFGLVVAVFVVFDFGYCNYINKSLKHIKRDLEIQKPFAMTMVPLFVETFYKQIIDNVKKQNKYGIFMRMNKVSNVLLALGIDIRKFVFRDVRKFFGGNLKYIICGGAPLNTDYIAKYRSFGIEILNGYGTTECSPCIAVNRNHHHEDGTVGLVFPNAKVKIMEDGEVCVNGQIVMQGYYNMPEETDMVLKDGWYFTKLLKKSLILQLAIKR